MITAQKERKVVMNRRISNFCFIFSVFLVLNLISAGQIHADIPSDTTGTVDHNKGVEIGDPISANAGAYHFSVPLLDLGGPLPLIYSLSYRMDQVSSRSLASNFQASTDMSLELLFNGSRLMVYLANGETLTFVNNGDWNIDSASSIKYILIETGADENNGYYYIADPVRELVYIFEKTAQDENAPGSRNGTARIVYIMDRNGNKLEFTYGSTAFPFRPDQISDGLGRTLTFSYSSGTGKVTQVTDQCGRTVLINQDDGELISTTDAMGQTSTYHYNSDGYVISCEHPEGNIPYTNTADWIQMSWFSSERVTSQTDAYGNTVALAYDTDVTETRPDGTTVIYEHYSVSDNNGPLKSVTDPAGNTATVNTTSNEQISSITDRIGDTTNITYHAETGKISSFTDATGHTTTYTYTPIDQTFTNPDNAETVTFTFYDLTRIDYADGTHETFSYDSNGNVLSMQDRAGKTWSRTYNGRGQVLTAINPSGGTVTFTYNADATMATKTDPDTGTTTFQYDGCKRISQVTHPDTTSVLITYNADDQITSITDERGNTFDYSYDANGNPIIITDPGGNSVEYAYDLMDRVTTVTDQRGQASTSTYDNMGRKASETDPNGIIRTYEYDPRGWINRITVGSQSWQIGYDDEGVISSVTTPLGFTTSYQSNKLGKVTRITDPLGNYINLTRDARQRITGITDPLGQTMTFEYNGWDTFDSVDMPVIGTAIYQHNDLGLLNEITDPKGNKWRFDYTGMGRPSGHSDPLGNEWNFSYDSRGFIDRIIFPDGGTVVMTYDNAGNLVQSAFSKGPTFNYVYDDDLNRITDADQIGFTYDEAGNILSTDNRGSEFTATYDAGGRVLTVSYAGGAFTVTYNYDSTTGLLTGVSDDLTGTTITFVYDDDMRLTGINRSNALNTMFTWDQAGRLTRIQHGTVADIQYELDAAGQITGMDMHVPLDPAEFLSTSTDTYVYNSADEVTSAGYTYNLRGQRTADAIRNYTWDAAGRLTAAGNATFTYNGLGNLISRTVGDETISYYYNYAVGPNTIMAERVGDSGEWLRYYVYTPDGRLLYLIDAGDANEVYFYHFDHIGSTLFLTDETGSVTDSYAYTPYGKMLAHTGTNVQPFTWAGAFGVRREGSDGNFYQMRARYFDAVTAAFISRDPMWPRISSPKSLNPYQYALRNPVSMVDPDGMEDTYSEIRERLHKLDMDIAQTKADINKLKEEIRGIETAKAVSGVPHSYCRSGDIAPNIAADPRLQMMVEAGGPSLNQLYSFAARIEAKQTQINNAGYALKDMNKKRKNLIERLRKALFREAIKRRKKMFEQATTFKLLEMFGYMLVRGKFTITPILNPSGDGLPKSARKIIQKLLPLQMKSWNDKVDLNSLTSLLSNQSNFESVVR